MTKHLHHITPIHLGGEDGPLVLLEDYEHAQLHFERFMRGDDRWLHGSFLKFLEPEQVEAAKSRYSKLMTGRNNVMFGVEPVVKGWKWWTDGNKDVMSEKQPGPNFFQGRTNVSTGHESVKGQTWWNNGNEEILGFECPEGFIQGRLPFSLETKQKMSESQIGFSWWNNGKVEVQSKTQPDGFTKGRLIKKTKHWVTINVYDTVTKETTIFESIKECYTHFGVTKKVLRNRLETEKLLLDRYVVRRVKVTGG